MATAIWGAVIYGLVGVVVALWKRPEDVDRARRARDLQAALDLRYRVRPLWLEVLAMSIVRAIVWPLHLLVNED